MPVDSGLKSRSARYHSMLSQADKVANPDHKTLLQKHLHDARDPENPVNKIHLTGTLERFLDEVDNPNICSNLLDLPDHHHQERPEIVK